PSREAELVGEPGPRHHEQSNAGNDRTCGIVEDRRLQSLLLAAAMEEAPPGDERGPDRKRAAERPDEEPGGYGAKHTNANCESCIRGHLTPLFGGERADAPRLRPATRSLLEACFYARP